MRTNHLPYATHSFINSTLKEDYPYASTGGDLFLFPRLTVEPLLRFEYEQPDTNTLIVHTVEFSTMISGNGFIDFVFKKEAGKWKMDKYDTKFAGKIILNLLGKKLNLL